MTHPVRIGINGFGRIGRCLFKNALARGEAVAGINDLADLGDLAYLLKYDSVHGWWGRKVSHTDKELVRLGRDLSHDSRISDDWHVRGVPTHFIVDGAGIVRFRVVGYATTWGLKARLWWAENFPA